MTNEKEINHFGLDQSMSVWSLALSSLFFPFVCFVWKESVYLTFFFPLSHDPFHK